MADEPIPARVQALADQANGTPRAWREDKTSIVIVFVDGRKLTFDKAPAPAQAEEEPAPPVAVPNLHKKGKGK
jgi:hypothetical protein